MDRFTASAIDANINRALEGLRVCEDIMRFSLRRHEHSPRFKELRHAVKNAAAVFSADLLLAGRDVAGDGQRFADDERPADRDDVAGVFAANLHRATEALRSLEEFSKLVKDRRAAARGRTVPDAQSPAEPALPLASRFQQVRFALYELEKEIMPLITRSGLVARLYGGLYAILDSAFIGDGRWLEAARGLIDGGAAVVQLRMKGAPGGAMAAVARDLAPLCRSAGVLFIVNDRPDVALAADADGVHLGQDDLSVAEARRIVTPGMIVGLSTHSLEQARAGAAARPDYCAIGPIYGTASKTGDAIPAIGAGLIGPVKEAVGDIPLVAIGGMDPRRAREARGAGADSVAAIAYLYGGSIEERCREMAAAVRS